MFSTPSSSTSTSSSTTTSTSSSTWSGHLDASALPRCDLSDFLESFVNTRIQEKQTEIAARQNMQSENIERPDDLVIRVVCNDVCKDSIQNSYYDMNIVIIVPELWIGLFIHIASINQMVFSENISSFFSSLSTEMYLCLSSKLPQQ